MKLTKHILTLIALFVFVAIFIASSKKTYFQQYTVTPVDGTVGEKAISYETDILRIEYDLWANGGDIGFWITNKTKADLIVFLDHSFFVINGHAYDYYQNRAFSQSTKLNVATGSGSNAKSVSSEKNTTFYEQKEMIIPAEATKRVKEFSIVSEYYNDCSLIMYPGNQSSKITYTAETSPFVFHNIITYSNSDDTSTIYNKFFVTEIFNSSEEFLKVKVDASKCAGVQYPSKWVIKDLGPNHFYYKYDSPK